MNYHAGIRNGACTKPGCLCRRYVQQDGQGEQPCECNCSRRRHLQVWRPEFRPLVTTGGWGPEAA